MRYGWDGGDWVFVVGRVVSLVVWLAIIVGLIVLIVLAVRWLLAQGGAGRGGRGYGPGPNPDDPLEILRQRYARGEIDDEEFERRKRMLGG